jgi:hypothetical protein
LNASNNSNFFCFPRPTWAAFFSTLFTSLNNYAINYMILNNNLLFLDTVFCNYAKFYKSKAFISLWGSLWDLWWFHVRYLIKESF